jgi:hypothetical protein
LCTWAKVLDLTEAQWKWSQWEAQEQESQDPNGELYMTRDADTNLLVRVPTMLEMNFRTTTKRLNEVVATTSSEKNVSQERLDSYVAKVGLHLDKMGATEINLDSIAQQTLATSGSNPMVHGADVAGVFSDVKALLPEPDAEDEAGDDEDDDDFFDGGEDDEQLNGKDNNKKGKKKLGEWWARDEFIVKKETELEGLISKDEAALQTPYDELKAEVEAPSDACSFVL